eukprot:TRINITY_DN67028_c5_g1_i3.p1 TRINITY_DN67028_c5_g1~~TRINITY_DN67028_c5_g1_i3.p1  ORF type:complete len:613 (-),score=36.28 TRINITY_DN67028_c5_g1_i3:419-2257(-)
MMVQINGKRWFTLSVVMFCITMFLWLNPHLSVGNHQTPKPKKHKRREPITRTEHVVKRNTEPHEPLVSEKPNSELQTVAADNPMKNEDEAEGLPQEEIENEEEERTEHKVEEGEEQEQEHEPTEEGDVADEVIEEQPQGAADAGGEAKSKKKKRHPQEWPTLTFPKDGDGCPGVWKQLKWTDKGKHKHPCKFISPRKHGVRAKWLNAIKHTSMLEYTGHLIYKKLTKSDGQKLWQQHCLLGISYELGYMVGWNKTRGHIMSGWVDGCSSMHSKSKMVMMMRKWAETHQCNLDTVSLYPLQFMSKESTDCNNFMDSYVRLTKPASKPVQEWITKSAGGSLGSGIKFYKDSKFAKDWTCGPNGTRPKDTVIQELLKPYLLENHKCHFRFYMLIGSTDPWMIFWYPGMASCSGVNYNHAKAFGKKSKTMMLTNTHQQRVNASAARLFTIDEVGEYLENEGVMTKQQWWKKYRNYGHWLSQLIVLAAKSHLRPRLAAFHNFAIDVMMSDDLRLNFLEVNVAAGARLLMKPSLPIDILKLTMDMYLGNLNIHKMPHGNTGIGDWELVWSQTWGVPWVHPEAGPPPCACGQTEGCNPKYTAPPLCTKLSTEQPGYPNN